MLCYLQKIKGLDQNCVTSQPGAGKCPNKAMLQPARSLAPAKLFARLVHNATETDFAEWTANHYAFPINCHPVASSKKQAYNKCKKAHLSKNHFTLKALINSMKSEIVNKIQHSGHKLTSRNVISGCQSIFIIITT